ncbi:MAG TPA: nucleotidyl transferase AbiEii/AbiGii toxin family protein [Deltaproteobacteria bacterium]|nr:nucleotidyl transferase AbiEii/AbiGii toxin family protein [Deltaproteobacteria bacterium]
MKIGKDIINYLANKTGIKQKELIEKDILLQLLLKELTGDEHFKTNYVFKGGTCLIKCYIGYYRFSEDLDFSWINQEMFTDKTEKQIRKQLSGEINTLGGLLEDTAEKLDLDFKLDKQDRHYLEFGGSNRFVTFKLWYDSIELKTRQFTKIQVNYVEKFKHDFKEMQAKNILSDIDTREFKFLYPEAAEVLENPTILAYDIREILSEKIRAILMRRGTKARDYIDIYLIQKQANIEAEDVEAQVMEKTKYMMRYEKYWKNIQQKTKNKPKFKLGDEEKLLLKPLDPQFHQFLKKFNKTIDKLLWLKAKIAKGKKKPCQVG